MQTKHSRFWLACLGLMIWGHLAVVHAHHSSAMFDHKNVVTLTGTVKTFEWTSPHVWIFVTVPNEDKQDTWAIESNDPSGMSRRGWNKNLIKPGDKVTVRVGPRIDGQLSGFLYDVTLPDGRVISGGATPRSFE